MFFLVLVIDLPRKLALHTNFWKKGLESVIHTIETVQSYKGVGFLLAWKLLSLKKDMQKNSTVRLIHYFKGCGKPNSGNLHCSQLYLKEKKIKRVLTMLVFILIILWLFVMLPFSGCIEYFKNPKIWWITCILFRRHFPLMMHFLSRIFSWKSVSFLVLPTSQFPYAF